MAYEWRGGAIVAAANEKTAQRMADLERRIQTLEERTRDALWSEDCRSRQAELTQRYGEVVDKTVAAGILGVTRTTVYAMLEDGRILGACGGRRVDVRSIARYLSQPGTGYGRRKRGQPVAGSVAGRVQ